jgi:hypothetical protein
MMRFSVTSLLLLTIFVSRAQISGTGSVLSITANSATVVDPNLTLSGTGNLSDMTVQITGGYISGSSGDILSYSGSLPGGIASTFDNVHGILRFYGTTSVSNWQTLLRTVTLSTTSSSCYAQKRSVTFVLGDKLYNPTNGHFYVRSSTYTNWTDTKNAASETVYYGRKGYLTTITSKDENNFVWTMTGYRFNWLGASDNYTDINAALNRTVYANQNASDGNFHWLTGPEVGMPVSTGNSWNSGPNAVNNSYFNWESTEPNDYPNLNSSTNGEEDYVILYDYSGEWNDIYNAYTAEGIYEYGDMPQDMPQVAHSTRNILISNGVSSGVITGGDVDVCPGTNSTALTLTGLNGSVVRWESSLDANFLFPTSISNTTTSLTVTNISQTTFYRAIVNSNSPSSCSNLPTSGTKINVTTTITGNIIADNNSICASGLVHLTLYGNQTDILKWQRSTSSTFASSITDISNTTAFLNDQRNSTGTYYYRAQVQNNGCGSPAFTSILPITVVSGTPSVGGTVNSRILCGGSNSGSVTLSGRTGSILNWESSTDGLIWSNISNTSATNSYTGLTSTIMYRSNVQNGSCPAEKSTIGTVEVVNGKNVWFGTTSSSWQTASNWCGGVPSLTTDVVIPNSNLTPNDPNLSSGTGLCRDIEIRSNGTLTISSNRALQIAGDLLTLGTLNAGSGNIQLVGTGSTQKITGVITVDTFVMNNTNGVTLQDNVNINNRLRLVNGVVYTSTNSMLILDNDADLVGGGTASHVSGPMQKTLYRNGSSNIFSTFTFPLGKDGKYAPCNLNRNGGSTVNYSVPFTAEYFNVPYSDLSTASGLNKVSTKEYWNINRPSGTTPTFDVTLYFYDKYFSGIPNNSPTDLIVAHYNGTDWEDISALSNSSTSNSATLSAVATFSPFTFGSLGGLNPLPVSLVAFNATPNTASKTVDLSWQTASEENNKYFEVLYSTDLNNWKTIGILNSKGNSDQMNNYFMLHSNTSAINYYKLKQVDNDGKYAFSDIKVVKFNDGNNTVVVYPNPSAGIVIIQNATDANYQVIDITGKVIMSGTFNTSIQLTNLPKGLFVIRVESEEGVHTEKITVQ